MKIYQPYKETRDHLVRYLFPFELQGKQEVLYYEIDSKYEPLVEIVCDAAVVGLLIPAMKANENIEVIGDVSKGLATKIDSGLVSIIKMLIPNINEIGLHFTSLIESDTKGNQKGVATGFSGGIDSYSVIQEYFEEAATVKITHLLFNNVGSHGEGGTELFETRYSRLVGKAKEMGLPFVKVNSNLDDFYSAGIGFQQTHTLRNASVALLLQNGINTFLYGSTYQYKDMKIGGSYDSAYMDPMILSLTSSDKLNALAIGSKYSRVRKTEIVSECTYTYSSLDVCVSTSNTSEFNNCGKCWKCMRTLLTLDIIGKINLYSDSFDLREYYSLKKEYINKVFSSDDKLLIEIVELSKRENFKAPKKAKILNAVKIPFFKSKARVIKKIIKSSL